jgi:hypothetical protein
VINWTGRRGHTARLTVVGTPPSTDLAKGMTEIELGLDTIVDLMSRASGPALFRAGKQFPRGGLTGGRTGYIACQEQPDIVRMNCLARPCPVPVRSNSIH